MYAQRRYAVVPLLFVFCLLLTALPAKAQENSQADTVVTITGATMQTRREDVPTAPALAAETLAADQDFQNKVAFVNSLTQEQRTAFGAILTQERTELESIAQEVQTTLAQAAAQKVFLPLATISQHDQANAAETDNATTQRAQIDARINDVSARMGSIQTTINTALVALLTPEQQALFAKTDFAQTPKSLTTSTARMAADSQSSTDCYYGAYYGGIAYYWAWYAEYYAYLDYIYVNNAYSYNDWYYNYYAKQYITSATLYAGGAYAIVIGGSSAVNWVNTAYSEFGNALPNADAGRYYGYWAWQYGSGYGYYGYLYADYAYYYAYWAQYYTGYCSQ